MSLQNKHCCWLLGCPGPPESGGRQRGVSRPPPPWAGLSRPMAPEAGHPCGHPEPQKSPSVVPEGGLAPGRGWVSMGWPWWPGGARPDPTLASLPRARGSGGPGGRRGPPSFLPALCRRGPLSQAPPRGPRSEQPPPTPVFLLRQRGMFASWNKAPPPPSQASSSPGPTLASGGPMWGQPAAPCPQGGYT